MCKKKVSEVVLFKGRYTPEVLRKNRDTLFIFGDNMLRRGKGGQAIIRDEPNAFGIATKKRPSNSKDAFFSDDCKECIETLKSDIQKLEELIASGKYKKVAFPEGGIGTGLAKLPEKAPNLYKEITRLYDKYLKT